MKVLIVEKDKIINNLDKIREKSGGVPVIAVLKANAYGLDLRQMAELLREQGIRRFAVTEPQDAVRLRDWGFNEEEILILRSTSCAEDIKQILTACATATIGSYDAAVALNGLAEKDGVSCDVHIKVDTGMGRYGFEPSELERILSVYRFMTNLNVTGMYTHFPCAFRSRKKTLEQCNVLLDVAAKVRQAGLEPGMLHAANSAGLFYCNLPALDAVRPGSSIGGRMTCRGDHGLQKTGRLQSSVAEVRWLTKGHTIGYGSAYTTKKPTKIAIIPVGTADGYMLEKARDSFRFGDCVRYALSGFKSFLTGKRFYVLINGKRARVLGHVGVNHTIADVTDIDCAPGDIASFDVSPMFVPESVERRYV